MMGFLELNPDLADPRKSQPEHDFILTQHDYRAAIN